MHRPDERSTLTWSGGADPGGAAVPTAAEGPIQVRGAVEVEPTPGGLRIHRLSAHARTQLPDAVLASVESQPAGVRLAFRTTATRLELRVRTSRIDVPDGAYASPAGSYELTTDGRVVSSAACEAAGAHTFTEGRRVEVRPAPVSTLRLDGLPGTEVDAEIWLPYLEECTLVGLGGDGRLLPPTPCTPPRWTHHGSSISQGAFADGPTGTWPAIAARRLGLDLTNLGLAANAVLDPFVARTVRDLPADLVTLKLGINLVNHDVMRFRSFGPAVEGFLDTVRDGHPEVPLVIISPLCCPPVEDGPGPSVIDPTSPPDSPRFIAGPAYPYGPGDDRLTLRRIRDELRRVVERRVNAGDGALAYIDGLTLFGRDDASHLSDLLHPDPAGQKVIGERFPSAVRGAVGSMTSAAATTLSATLR